MDDSVLTSLVGSAPVRRRPATGGYTPAERWIVELADGRSVFVKAATNDLTSEWLRSEHRLYEALGGPYMPKLIGWSEVGDYPILVLEDLSMYVWPPPWTNARVAAVLQTLSDVAATPPPPWLPRTSDASYFARGWQAVAEDPAPLLGTGIVAAGWLANALPLLVQASAACRLSGDELCHLDVRSDNMCFRPAGSAVLVDWNHAECGNRRLDVAFWLPSLVDEEGPAPEDVLPDAGPEAAIVSGYFASRAGLPPIIDAPRVRPAQMSQLRRALPWACRALGLSPP